MNRIGVVIVAAGRGNRMKSEIPKQFLMLSGKPILVHTVERVMDLLPNAEIVVVISPEEEQRWRDIANEFNLLERHRICSGGATRFESVKNGLKSLDNCDLIAVQDGVRPFFSRQMVDNLIATATTYGAAIPAVNAIDSFRMITPSGVSQVVDRNLLKAVQTPQIFKAQILIDAYNNSKSMNFTDDASLVESFGTQIALCEGEYTNIKITTPADIPVAAEILSQEYERGSKKV